MPGKKHLGGVGSKEQRQYEHIKESAQKSGRYGKRAKEVAARTVMKHHQEAGHSKHTAVTAEKCFGMLYCLLGFPLLCLVSVFDVDERAVTACRLKTSLFGRGTTTNTRMNLHLQLPRNMRRQQMLLWTARW
jgi:hypothetical protein